VSKSLFMGYSYYDILGRGSPEGGFKDGLFLFVWLRATLARMRHNRRSPAIDYSAIGFPDRPPVLGFFGAADP
jgi:hypothetical protein